MNIVIITQDVFQNIISTLDPISISRSNPLNLRLTDSTDQYSQPVHFLPTSHLPS